MPTDVEARLNEHFRSRLERLNVSIVHGHPAERLGVSPDAYEDFVEWLSTTRVPEWSLGESTRARVWMAVLGASTLTQAAQMLCDLTGTDVYTCRDVMDDRGHGPRVPYATVNQMVVSLLAGDDGRAASTRSGCSPKFARHWRRELGIAEAQNDRVLDAVIAMVRADATAPEIADALGLAKTTAIALRYKAKHVLAELGEL
jgi:hypothetical protein